TAESGTEGNEDRGRTGWNSQSVERSNGSRVMKRTTRTLTRRSHDYDAMLNRVVRLIDEARRVSARTVNALMTATYWLIGRHIVEFEQQGKKRAEYGEELLVRMATDLTSRFGRGFSRQNLQQMRQFYEAFPTGQI